MFISGNRLVGQRAILKTSIDLSFYRNAKTSFSLQNLWRRTGGRAGWLAGWLAGFIKMSIVFSLKKTNWGHCLRIKIQQSYIKLNLFTLQFIMYKIDR